MNHNGAPVDARLQHLLEVVERNRDERCRALREEAREEVRQIVQRAHREARARLRGKILATREEVQRKLAMTEARHQTHLRLQRHRADQALLGRAWAPLRERMQQRWQQADCRRQWIAGLVEQATALLVDRHWQIEHPLDWDPQERTVLESQLGRELGSTPRFTAHPQISAGLRIRAGSACIDGTLDGLLRAGTRLESLMLATLNECRRRLNGTNLPVVSPNG